MISDIPEEDKLLFEMKESFQVTPVSNTQLCQHEYVDLYCGWGSAKSDPDVRLVWMVCKRCLDKKQIRLNMHNVASPPDEDEDEDD